MDKEFNEGDVVQLKSGGPKMTLDFMGDKYLCYYFYEGKLLRVEVRPHSLKKVSSGPHVSAR